MCRLLRCAAFLACPISVIDIDEGYIVRIKSSAVVLSDAWFVDAAQNSIRSRIRDYNQASQSQPTPGVLPPTNNTEDPQPEITVPDDPDDTSVIPAYLGFSCEDAQGLSEILDTLDSYSQRAIFFFDAEGLEREDDLIFRILGSGHSIGLIAQGRTAAGTRRLLEQANETLRRWPIPAPRWSWCQRTSGRSWSKRVGSVGTRRPRRSQIRV